jgi:galactose-1-phosphate uridylyltransferase
MSAAMTQEDFTEILSKSAVRRFGEERAKDLAPVIQDLAKSLAAVAEHPVEFEEEPAFYF